MLCLFITGICLNPTGDSTVDALSCEIQKHLNEAVSLVPVKREGFLLDCFLVPKKIRAMG